MALDGEMENKKAGKSACRWLMQELRQCDRCEIRGCAWGREQSEESGMTRYRCIRPIEIQDGVLWWKKVRWALAVAGLSQPTF
jgi:hypothetical protein